MLSSYHGITGVIGVLNAKAKLTIAAITLCLA